MCINFKFAFYPIASFLLLFGLCYSVFPQDSAEDETPVPPSSTFLDQHIQIPKHTSSKSFSFNGVYQLALSTELPGNVNIIAIDSKIENKSRINAKHEIQIVKKHPILTQSNLDNITIIGINKDGVLQLSSNISELALKQSPESPIAFDAKEHIRINYVIETPPDVSLKLENTDGNTYIHHLRGNIEITTQSGDIHLDETLGIYQIDVQHGIVHGNILLAPGQSDIKTNNGSIHLTFLDALSAPLNLTSIGGGIKLLLPKNYAADLVLNSGKEHYIINLSGEIVDNQGFINGGGPLLNLNASETISLLQHPTLQNGNINVETGTEIDEPLPELEISVPLTTNSPVIDGNLLENAWLNGELLHEFWNPSGSEKAANKTEVYLMWDADNFYIGGRAYFASYSVPRVSQTQHDSPIWEDEAIEILLDMDTKTEGYSHLIVNPINGVFDQWVQKVGFPTIKFFPKDVSRESQTESVEQFKSDISWNSEAKVATQIYTNFWSFEIAFPHNLSSVSNKASWLFNIHRKAQGKNRAGTYLGSTLHREYSYWSPVYDEDFPWWPHWKEAMGALKLHNSITSSSKNFDLPETFEVITIEIEGNTTIPTEEIYKSIPIASGDILSNEKLAMLISELKAIDWFREVQLKTVILNGEKPIDLPESPEIHEGPDEAIDQERENKLSDEILKVVLQINLTEAPGQRIKKISIEGNKNFPTHFIKNWFDLSAGYVTQTNASLKQMMMKEFYLNRGFPFVEVSHEFVNESLQFIIDEGYLDEIRFTGHRRISKEELLTALGISTESVYFNSLGQSKINQFGKNLEKNNNLFKSIRNWYTQREGGRNILFVEIEEEPALRPGWNPIVGFNRVHGVVLGVDGALPTQFTGEEQLFGSVSFGFASKKLNYRFGIEKNFFRRFPLGIGLGIFRLTNIISNDYRLLATEANLSAAVYGSAFEDYYQHQGEHIWLAQWLGKSSLIRLEYTQEDNNNLFKSTDWSYFNRSLIKRGNLRIETGHSKMLVLGYTFDTRDHKSAINRRRSVGSHLISLPNPRTKNGWRGHLGFEYVGGVLGGEYTYNKYKFELVKYTQIFGPNNINIRVSGAFSDSALPTQHLLYLGGATTLRGYRFNRYAGDKRILFNIEYRISDEFRIASNRDIVYGWSLNTFFDAGRVWWYNENPLNDFSLNQLKTSIGFGFSYYIIPPSQLQPLSTVIKIAMPLNVNESFARPVVILRLERMF